MNTMRLTAVVGAFALLSPTVQAQGLLSQIFSSPQSMYTVGHTNGSCSTGICGPNGCQVPGRVPTVTSPLYQGVNSPGQPYFSNGTGILNPGYNQPGYSSPGNHYPYSGNGQYGAGRPGPNFPFSNSDVMNHNSSRPSRTPGSNFNVTPTHPGNRPDLDWQFSNPMFTRANGNSPIPMNGLPVQQNGWTMY